MRIVFATMFLENAGGGMGRVAYEIPFAFAKKGHTVLFVNSGQETKAVEGNKIISLQIKSSGGEFSFPDLSWKDVHFLFKNLSEFSPNVIHVPDLGPLAFLLQIWAKENNTPFFYTSHVLPTKFSDFGPKEFSENIGKLLDSRLLKKYFSNFYGSCDGMVALNKEAEKDIKKFGYKGKIFVIPNGRDLGLYNKRKTISVVSSKKHLVFIGWLSPRKNQKYLLEVMRFLPKDYVLDLVGGALSEKYFSDLKRYTEQYHLDNVNFVGQVEHKQIPGYLRKAFALVSASKMEVQSLVILEALASGTPVIGLSNETIDELIDEKVGIRLPKNSSPKIFAQQIEKLALLSKEDYGRVSRNAREKVKDFSWEKVVDQTISAYKEVAQTKPRVKKIKSLPKNDWEQVLEKIKWPIFLKFKENLEKKEKSGFPGRDFYISLIILAAFLGNSLYKMTKLLKELKEKNWFSLE